MVLSSSASLGLLSRPAVAWAPSFAELACRYCDIPLLLRSSSISLLSRDFFKNFFFPLYRHLRLLRFRQSTKNSEIERRTAAAEDNLSWKDLLWELKKQFIGALLSVACQQKKWTTRRAECIASSASLRWSLSCKERSYGKRRDILRWTMRAKSVIRPLALSMRTGASWDQRCSNKRTVNFRSGQGRASSWMTGWCRPLALRRTQLVWRGQLEQTAEAPSRR